MLPSITWNIDPVLYHIPRVPFLYVIGALGTLSLIRALFKKDRELATSGITILGLTAMLSFMLTGDIQIRYYSLIFVCVFFGGYTLFNWQVRRAGGTEAEASDCVVYGIAGVLLGSRIGHVLFYDFDKFLEDPIWLFKIWQGGLASHGAVLGLITTLFLFTYRRRVPFLEGCDRFAFSAALGATLVRFGNFFNSEIVGRVTDGSWGVRFPRYDGPDAPLRHPSQLYEMTLGIGILVALWAFDRALGREKRPRGALSALFFALYFTGRFLVEYFKEYQALAQGSLFTMGQILSIPGIVLGYFGLIWVMRRKEPAGWSPGALPATAVSTSATPPAYDPDVEDEFDKDKDKPEDEAK